MPRLEIRFRQRRSDELTVRLIDSTQGLALERTLAYTTANKWQTERLDLHAMVCQTDRDFFCDELRLFADPQAELQINFVRAVG
jgi:hypothetical protein